MLSSLLEKAIGSGKAYYTKYTHAFSTFGSLTIPEDTTVVVTDIKWNHFFSGITDNLSSTIRDVIRNNEYQLKIDGNKSVNYMTYRNQININLFNDIASSVYGEISLDTPVLELYSGSGGSGVACGMLQLGAPIIQDVFFVCQKYVKLTITRNCYGQQTSVGTVGTLNPSAAEQRLPNGVSNANLLLHATLDSPAPITQMVIAPPNKENANAPNNLRLHENYIQDINGTYSICYSPFNAGLLNTINMPFATTPLVELGLVIFNNNNFDKVMNS